MFSLCPNQSPDALAPTLKATVERVKSEKVKTTHLNSFGKLGYNRRRGVDLGLEEDS